ncbi:MAG: phosphatidylserine decarboxylase [Alphaproteobacteria bacterium]|jgi:phosphatidylserine decarboxylase|nr:phosphatidylserine decarboxylase [Alphaproteobacteria bacterium]
MSLFLPIRIHPEGWRFIVIFAVLSVVLFYVAEPLGWIGLILTGWCAYFFRNPKRITPTQGGLIVSPADGIVCAITTMPPPAELDMGKAPHLRISIFLNVFDVHVNRIAIGGKIVKSVYSPGHFLNAASHKASDHNERQSLVIETTNHTKVAFVQIAGLIARRIVCNVKQGDTVETGAVYGLIRFGSRMDIYLPEGINPLIIEGQRMIAGESVIADLNAKAMPKKVLREGTCH